MKYTGRQVKYLNFCSMNLYVKIEKHIVKIKDRNKSKFR